MRTGDSGRRIPPGAPAHPRRTARSTPRAGSRTRPCRRRRRQRRRQSPLRGSGRRRTRARIPSPADSDRPGRAPVPRPRPRPKRSRRCSCRRRRRRGSACEGSRLPAGFRPSRRFPTLRCARARGRRTSSVPRAQMVAFDGAPATRAHQDRMKPRGPERRQPRAPCQSMSCRAASAFAVARHGSPRPRTADCGVTGTHRTAAAVLSRVTVHQTAKTGATCEKPWRTVRGLPARLLRREFSEPG